MNADSLSIARTTLKITYSFRHLEFGLIDTSGMSEQQRREISYTVVQSQSVQQSPLQSNNSRLDDTDSSSLPRYDDLKTACNLHNHPPQLEDETGSVVIVQLPPHPNFPFACIFFYLFRACILSLSMPPIIYLKHDEFLNK